MKGLMKAAAIDGFGPPSVLGLHQLPIPEPGPDEILIALAAAGVGVWDAEVRDGSWQPAGKPKFPFVLGTDGAGMVAAKGARVRRFKCRRARVGLQLCKSERWILRRIRGCKGARCRAGSEAS